MTTTCTPILNRLRKRPNSQDRTKGVTYTDSTDLAMGKTKTSQGHNQGGKGVDGRDDELQNQGGKEGQVHDEPQNYSSLLEYIRILQEKTEQSMNETFKSSMQTSKEEIKDLREDMKGMVSTLTMSVDSLKQELKTMKVSFEGKFDKIKTDMTGLDSRLNDIESEQKKYEWVANEEKNALEKKIKAMEDEALTSKRKVEADLRVLRQEMETLRNEQ